MACERKDSTLLREDLHDLLSYAERYLTLNRDTPKQKWNLILSALEVNVRQELAGSTY